MTWLAAIWAPEAVLLTGLAAAPGVVLRRALLDQGPYTAGGPFDVLALGEAALTSPTALGERVWAWRVERRDVRVAPDPCPLTMVALTRRRPGLSRAGFARHWTEEHAPLALRHHVGVTDYRQHVVLEALTSGADEVDGIATLGFASRADFETRFYDSERGKAAIRDDVRRFIAARGGDTTLVGPPERAVGAG